MLLFRETLMRTTGWIVLFSGLVVGGLADAAMPIVVDGTLRGATGVEVAGSVYDVEFVEGSCSSLFAGCDEDSDFLFTDRATAGRGRWVCLRCGVRGGKLQFSLCRL